MIELIRKNQAYILFVLLLVVASVFFFNRKNGTISKRESNFIPPDVSLIDRVIFIQGNDTLILERNNENWALNGDQQARMDRIELFITSLNKLDIVSPASKMVKQQVSEHLRSQGCEVMIYTYGKLRRSFYVLYDTTGIPGTYMLLKKFNTPFIVRLKGFDTGNIEGLFSPDPDIWRENLLLNLNPSDIQSVSIDYPDDSEASFFILQNQEGGLELSTINQPPVEVPPDLQVPEPVEGPQDLQVPEPVEGPDSESYHASISTGSMTGKGSVISSEKTDFQEIEDYLYSFKNIRYQYPQVALPENTFYEGSFAKLQVSAYDGRETDLEAYRLPTVKNSQEPFDPVRFVGVIHHEQDTVILRYEDMDPVFRQMVDFQKK